MAVVIATALILLLPILLPVLFIDEWWTRRRLARTRCVSCGALIGLAEFDRARLEAGGKAAARMKELLALGYRPRMVTIWDVRCPTCGQEYEYGGQLPLVAKRPGPPATT